MGLSKLGYKHEYVNHVAGEWVRGECHVNSCENRVSLLRPWLSVHRGICKDNLSLYLAAFKACRRFRKMKPVQAIIETIKIIYIVVATKILLKSELIFRLIKTNISSNIYKENYATKLRKENITKVGSHHWLFDSLVNSVCIGTIQ